MADERNKSVDSEGAVTGEYDSVKKKKRENKSAEDGEKLGEDIVVKKKSKKTKKLENNSVEDGEKIDEETVVKKKSKKRENKSGNDGEKLGEEIVVKKKKEVGSDLENDAKKSKKKKKRGNESAEEGEKLDEDIVVGKKSKKLENKSAEDGEKLEEDIVVKKQEKESAEDGEKMEKEIIVKKKSKKRESKSAEDGEKMGEDIEVKMKKKVGSEVEDDGKESKKKKKKSKKKAGGAESDENQGDETPLADADGANKKTSKRKRADSDLGAEENTEMKKKSNKKKKKKPVVEDTEVGEKTKEKKRKKVKFSDQPEVFLIEDQDREEEEEEESDEEKPELVRGKRFTKEEDELVKNAVLEYIDNHALGDEGLKMVMECKLHPQLRGCWKEIASAIPWRPHYSVYDRAHTLFEERSMGEWSQEDLELVKQFHRKHGNDWKTLADAMGKSRKHVKDAWRRIRLEARKRGHWSREEYQALFDLVNKEIKMKAFKEKLSKHGMLRDNIPWMAISDQLGSRDHVNCFGKWYAQLVSPMVQEGIWANVDDYRLMEELMKLDAACIDDVDWDNLLENRDGEACRKRWKQMVRHIGSPASKTFAEQVEILSERYCPDLAEDREDFDNRPYDPED